MNSKQMSVVVRKVMLASATLFQKKQRSLSKAPMLSGLLGLLKLLLVMAFHVFFLNQSSESDAEAMGE